jgi:methionyl aminopeptidase
LENGEKEHAMNKKGDKTGRNDPCPCGSGLKYKKCCLNAAGKARAPKAGPKKTQRKKGGVQIKSEKQIQGIRESGRLVSRTLEEVETLIRPGLQTEDINILVHDFTVQNGARPAPLNYRGFPKSVCVSVNEVICHGIPGKRVLKEGDIVNVDVTSILDGYYADASRTFFVGNCGPDARKIVDVAKKCLKRGIQAAMPGGFVGDIGHAIQRYAESRGCSVVREYVGHGVGLEFHEAPQVPHYGKKGHGTPLAPGMTLTIEPMINLGGKALRILDDQWTAVTADGSLSAQFEQTILITEEGNEALTPFDLD